MDGAISPETGAVSASSGLDFTANMRWLCVDIAGRLDAMRHIDMSQVAIRFCQTRRAVRHGVQATLTPLRFENGAETTVRKGERWLIEPVFDSQGRAMRYLISFYLPRFLNHPFREKLNTVFHELWHISPSFNGDLRRLPGRCYAHGPRGCEFEAQAARLAEQWLALDPPRDRYQFLEHEFKQLLRAHGRIFGVRLPTPRLVRVD